jgi:2-aminoethylphosphonate-pyruvate transaminase
MLTAFRLPAAIGYERLHDGLKAAGFTIYAGQGWLAPEIFRIATMGTIADADIERLLDTCHHLLTRSERMA